MQAPRTTPQPQPAPVPPKPNYDPFSSITSSHQPSRSSTPAPTSLLQAQQATKSPQPASGTFSALNPPTLRQATPQQPGLPTPSPSASIFDFAPSRTVTPQAPPAATAPAQASHATTADDDWNFSSALPEDAALPLSNELVVSNNSVKITFKASRNDSSDSVVSIMARFSNNTFKVITEYTFQVAVTKVRSTQ